ncbi:hypothetical protein DYBT9623_01967 [Dyadobacter sp. CECT 9623]|uniref:HMA domain-containing protein n=1 Tax=Dyadobacter linearis TaxID=2823330 RepID=A0ABM8UP33_9BACT|nr:hypothetical protein [Dyadobacter sp. CECT 9623]CAG5069231.1 hypothetical protein DYBT9623_01967 [Dyadobacter sp. CECT 9623]
MNEEKFTQEFVLIFRTNINSKRHVRSISHLLDGQTEILKWNIDLSDIDKVLRIEARQPDCRPVIALVQQAGYACEELTD